MSSTTWPTLRPPAEPRGVIVNLTAAASGRPAGSPQGNLQGSVRGMGRSATTGSGLPRDSGSRFQWQWDGLIDGSSAGRRSLDGGLVGEPVEVLSHADVSWRVVGRSDALAG